jgi:hypothetical protein
MTMQAVYHPGMHLKARSDMGKGGERRVKKTGVKTTQKDLYNKNMHGRNICNDKYLEIELETKKSKVLATIRKKVQ